MRAAAAARLQLLIFFSQIHLYENIYEIKLMIVRSTVINVRSSQKLAFGNYSIRLEL